MEREELTRKQLEAALGDGRTDFRGVDVVGQDLRGLDLSGVDFTGALLRYVNLENIAPNNAYELVLRDADLTGANLKGAQLMFAIMVRATLAVTPSTPEIFDEFTRLPTYDKYYEGMTIDGKPYDAKAWREQMRAHDGVIAQQSFPVGR